MFKRSLSIFAIIMLVFTASVSAAAPLSKEPTGSTDAGKKNSKITQLKKEELDKKYKSDDEVRVVVELQEAPAIEYATKKGKRYKDLPKAKKKELKAQKLERQKKVKAKVKEKKIGFKELENFTTVVNGFSAEMKYGKIVEIESIPEVSAVHIVNEYERPKDKPDMIYSKELVQAQEAWRDYGYTGEGMVVGIIDTGIDPSHRDMVLSNEEEAELTESEVYALKETDGLRGNYYTDKVPYGYNYMDDNEEILDLGEGASMHGMHVGGTVAANGDEENGGIKGVAPEAQLLALKVFGNDQDEQTTWGDIYIKAIDEAIVLGADVLNMSLGSTAGFVSPEDPEQQAVARAVDNGILMSISSGNSAHFGNGFANPDTENPDIGVAGTPGLAYDSLQVASLENSFLDLDAVTYTVNGETSKAPYMSASSVHPNSLEEKVYELAYAGIGTPEELEQANVKGKFALIQRGTLAFTEKALNAQAAGAAGVIIYNNADGFISMVTDPNIVIPQLFMLKADGDQLQQALAAGEKVTVTFNGEKTKAANPEAGKMSSFTSWGTAPNLDFKPEITAPGGQIYSTLNDDKYGMMSGTSMAAPHVSGGAALVLERADQEFKLEGFDRVNLAKNLMMNTSQPLIDKGIVNEALEWDIPYSPRRQGAGVMQLHSALSTPVVVTEADKKEAKVALKEVGNTFSFTLKAENLSGKPVEYDVAGNVQTDFAIEGQLGYLANELEAQKIIGATIQINGSDKKTIEVPANGSVTFKVDVDLSKAKVLGDDLETQVPIDSVFPNGYFVEGYVTLTDPADTNPELNVPYEGFKGKWDKAPILDETKYDKESFYGMGGMVTTIDTNTFDYLGYDPVAQTFNSKFIAISPNNDGVQDDLIPVMSFLRNAESVEYSILDAAGRSLRKIRTDQFVTKDYYDEGRGSYYSILENSRWDGKINNQTAKDGYYYYEIRALLDYDGAEWQTYKFPVKVDTAAPSLKAVKQGDMLEIKGTDNAGGSGIAYYDIEVDGKSILTEPLSPKIKEYSLKEIEGRKVQVIAADFAGNETSVKVNMDEGAEEADTAGPAVHITAPKTLSITNKKKVEITGYIEEPSGLKEFKIDGKKVKTNYDEGQKRYVFTHKQTFTDGVQGFTVTAVDKKNNTSTFKRTIMVDSEKPRLIISNIPQKVSAEDGTAKVNMKVQDNFDEIRVYVNGSEVFSQAFKEPYEMRGFSKTIKNVELPIKPGKNQFEILVTDLAGNQTKKKIAIKAK
ncbi:S8 family serine peptidase [Bacillus massiliglaciei]|uniref:S8 family serine peptidase n=1 Tax=Bacillus massiliglaciei TaxID=1816693 RepID=UPI000A97C887|nr:S8 family serine peptidase [Bacillus massiliglaciei]